MECSICKKPTIKCCSRCKTRYYCSPLCQKKDYANHVLDCPQRSADILVKNAIGDKLPTNKAVLYEYGFSNFFSLHDKSMLLGLYIGLIVHLNCNASQIHSWWINGELPLNIKKTYDDAGVNSGYYQWFLKNEHMLQGLHKYEGEKSDKSIADRNFAMARPYLSEHDQTIPIQSLSESKYNVLLFYIIIIGGTIPRIELKSWIDFGFCSCKFGNDYLEEEEENRLGDLYQELIIQKGCMIDEFNDAYISGSIMDLLRKKCGSSSSWLSENGIEFHGYNQMVKSVYLLKQYVLSDSVSLLPPVYADYGFMNCRTEDEKRQLKQMFRKLIKTPQFDLQDLHRACLAGKIFNYVKSILPNEVVKANLLKNLYPLKDLE
ncbi:hypothetical protein C1645_793327 [Glomus cerebriforme]|uniref:MYND-type domain-containing protein n=1 Tax=Glomus cerebriforme TaxID=658196 RepID=A0A397S5P9_9GLOM|nr:hypothetical protein C1645_793327 [Glomus cerebriforme]